MIRFKTLGLAAALALAAFATGAVAQEHGGKTPDRQTWSFAGPFGHYDQAQLQRGFKVFREVCSNCHSATGLSFRNLAEEGGPAFSEAQVKALAAEYKVQDGPGDDGSMFERPARPADRFPSNYANPEAAKAALGASPPDMTVLAKARSYKRGFPLFLIDPFIQYQEHGVDYIYSLIALGYTNAQDPNHNEYFPGGHIAMAKPLSDGQVEYTDGSPQTVQQYTKDVSSFLMWMAEPKLDVRKKTGFRVMVFLIIFAGLLYFTKRRVWAAAHGSHGEEPMKSV
jgi:ubiquinol-cytochrome c reductase cytochrome c1 subunit